MSEEGTDLKESAVRALLGHDYLSETVIHGFKSVLFGIPFVVAGVISVILADLSSGGGKGEMPREFALLLIAFFPFAGIMFIGHGVRGILRQQRIRKLQTMYSREPWKWDYPWKPDGIADWGTATMYKVIRIGIVFFLFLMPFNWLAFRSNEIAVGERFWQFMVGLFDLVTLFLFSYGAYLFLRRAKYGTGRLRFVSFPFHLGQTISVLFEGDDLLRNSRSFTATLRCIEERYEKKGQGGTDIVCYELYADKRTFSEPEVRLLNFSPLELNFKLPEKGPDTRLCERPPRYWELELAADTSGIDYRAFFLLPVYNSPGSPPGPDVR